MGSGQVGAQTDVSPLSLAVTLPPLLRQQRQRRHLQRGPLRCRGFWGELAALGQLRIAMDVPASPQPSCSSLRQLRAGAEGTRLSLSKPGLSPRSERPSHLCWPLLVPCLSPAALPLLGIVDAWVAPPAIGSCPLVPRAGCPQSSAQAGAFPLPLHPGDTQLPLGSHPLVASNVPRVLHQLSSAPHLTKKRKPTGFFRAAGGGQGGFPAL